MEDRKNIVGAQLNPVERAWLKGYSLKEVEAIHNKLYANSAKGDIMECEAYPESVADEAADEAADELKAICDFLFADDAKSETTDSKFSPDYVADEAMKWYFERCAKKNHRDRLDAERSKRERKAAVVGLDMKSVPADILECACIKDALRAIYVRMKKHTHSGDQQSKTKAQDKLNKARTFYWTRTAFYLGAKCAAYYADV